MASLSSSSSTSSTGFSNDAMHQKCFEILVKDSSDVDFVCDDGAVRIPAHRNVLASANPVFNAMFEGQLKEKGDVKIVDASSAVFREFLQFFYESEVKLTLENIGGVMKLIDKYDVEHGWPMCWEFLRTAISSDVSNVLWGLYLAVQFGNDDFMDFCLDAIQYNIVTVYKMIKFEENDTPKLRSSANHRQMSDENLASIFPLIRSVGGSRGTINMTVTPDQKIGNRFMPFTLTTGILDSANELREMQILNIDIRSDSNLTGICFSKLFKISNRTKEFEAIDCTIAIWIKRATRRQNSGSKYIVSAFENFKVTANSENYFKLPDTLISDSSDVYLSEYTIHIKMIPYAPPIYTYGSNVPRKNALLTPSISIDIKTEESTLLVSTLHFEQNEQHNE